MFWLELEQTKMNTNMKTVQINTEIIIKYHTTWKVSYLILIQYEINYIYRTTTILYYCLIIITLNKVSNIDGV